MGALSSLTGGGGLSGSGGAATGTSGDSKGGSVGGSRGGGTTGGLSAPVIFGGFKSDGGASLGVFDVKQAALLGFAVIAIGFIAYKLLKR
jgi:hypothetical protein